MTVHILKPAFNRKKRWVKHQRVEIPQTAHKVILPIFISLYPGDFIFKVSYKGVPGWKGLTGK